MAEDTSVDKRIQEERKRIRQMKLIERDALTGREELSSLISEAAIAYLNNIQAKFVHCYISFRSEVSTRLLIGSLLERGTRVAVPVVNVAVDGDHLIHTEVHSLADLKVGKFGLHEPSLVSEHTLEGLDVVIIPLSAFDRHGMRLGYGKGFYDKFLAQLPAGIPRIGLAFSMQEVPHIPLMPHDALLDVIITEKEIIRTLVRIDE
jgi:5-formyltetrahydrofolate cyclo-ligase